MPECCILIVGRNHYLAADAIALCQSNFRTVVVCDDADPRITNGALEQIACDLLVNFLGQRILPNSLLKFPNLNLHPGPPQYPGRGGASYALFDGAETYGATAHIMTENVDSGEILLADEFAIRPYVCCEALFAKAERSCLDLLAEALSILNHTGQLPKPNGMKWGRKPSTRKQFEAWLVLDPGDRQCFDRKVFAAYHSRLPGPYVAVHGMRFGMVKDEAAERIMRSLRKTFRK